MRKAGDIKLHLGHPGVAEAVETVDKKQRENLQASHHVDLFSGQEAYVNDGDPRSIIYSGGKEYEGRNEEYANPLEGQGPGAKELRNLSPQDHQMYQDIQQQLENKHYGTGDLAQGFANQYPFS